MTSQAKIEANRRNALRSTGPRTNAGKARSRRNALKHGLEVPLNRDDSFTGQIDAMTTELTPLLGKPSEIVRLAAERQLEVTRVQQTKVAIISRSQDVGAADDAVSDEARVAAAVAAALPDLVPLDRYERRALSRLKKFMRRIEEE